MKASLASRFTITAAVPASVTGCYEWIERPPYQCGYVCHNAEDICRAAGFAARHDKPLRGLTLPLTESKAEKLELDHLHPQYDV
uniref:hypothetical protein n=1 Tax=Klebsiella pneumoniae TaxID=573 RepID=UPI0022BA5114|nr:hypothetical protein [Klebsiella pneumoniae]